jgi:nondiscriminating glutamyl-tRNA synthetase
MDVRIQNSPSPRVRFAPSPTGYLHVGGARTAIFNWLYARRTGGTFVLRIEDTDVERSTRESEESLLDDLRWLGLDWDEGPDAGGGGGPYRQSERLALYQSAASALVDKGLAYACFCSDDELRRKKEAAIEEGRSPHYDGTCRNLPAEEVEAKRAAGVPHTIRFKVPDDSVTFVDLVRGEVTLDTDMVGDFVLMRSNGLPTYNFAAAHDDEHMRITHVLRGEEHLPNTLRQVLICRALDASPPRFGHLPLILAEDKSKLSKRHGASSVGELRARGFLPDAVVNYLALLGWSHPDEKEKLTRAEMIDSFSIDRVSKSAAVYDPKKLTWLNGLYIRDLSPEGWETLALPFLPDTIKEHYDAEAQRGILALFQNHVDTLDQLASQAKIFAGGIEYDNEAREVLVGEASRDILTELSRELASTPDDWTPELVKTVFKQVGKATGRKGKDLFFPIRAAITGNLHGPDLSRISAIKGKDAVAGLVKRALDLAP